MKTEKKLAMVSAIVLIVMVAASCASTGQYMALSKDETVIGTAQATFVVRSTVFMSKSGKDSVNTQAYIHLLADAGEKYADSIDIRDIVWVTGRSVDNENTEVSAAGKVVRLK